MANNTLPNVNYPGTLPKPPGGNVNHGPLLDASTAWTVALTCITVALRFWSRLRLTETKLWWDDWFILAAAIATVAGMSLDCVEVHYGFGRHEYYVDPHQLEFFRAYTYGEWIQTFFTLMCTKVSISFFLIRIPAPTQTRLLRPLKASVVVLIVSNVILTVLWCVQCRPVQAAWDVDVQGDCWSRDSLLQIILAQAIISVASDFAFAFYPIVILWNVNMTWQRKLGLRLLMGLGVITGACCIVRTVLNSESIPIHDLTFGGIVNWFWRLFEVQLGIIAASVPTLVPVYKSTVTPVLRKASRRFSSLRSSERPKSSAEAAYTGPKSAKPSMQHPAEQGSQSQIGSDSAEDEAPPDDKEPEYLSGGFFLALRSKRHDEEQPNVEHLDVAIPSPEITLYNENGDMDTAQERDIEKGLPDAET